MSSAFGKLPITVLKVFLVIVQVTYMRNTNTTEVVERMFLCPVLLFKVVISIVVKKYFRQPVRFLCS